MDKYKNEAAERFGGTDAYKEFEHRTESYTEADFQNASEGMEVIISKFAQCKAQGNTPDSPKAQTLLKELQSFITENFYTCTNEILKGLGVMYAEDERFRENIDKHGSGTAVFMASAIEFYTK